MSGVSPMAWFTLARVMFVAADQIIRYVYRIRATEQGEKVKLSTGWGHR